MTGTETGNETDEVARSPLDDVRDLWRTRARRVAAALAACGLAFDAASRAGAATVATTGAALVIIGVTWWAVPVRRRPARVALLAAGVFALGAAVRSSTWIVPLDLLAVAMLVILAVLLETRRADRPLQLGELAHAWLGAVASVPVAPLHVAVVAATSAPPADAATRRRAAAVLRGIVLAVPLTLLVGALLASADGVFRSFLALPIEPGDGARHLLAIAAGACLALLPLLRAPSRASAGPTAPAPGSSPDAPPARRAGGTGASELAVVVGVLTALYGLFAAAQTTALVRGDAYVQRTTGLTYAEYARAGYFQLLVVAALTAMVLLVVRAAATRPGAAGTRILRTLGVAAAALTLAILASAIRRLALYDAALGWTMLRLACVVFAVWMGVVFVALAVTIGGARPGRRDHLAVTLLVSAFATLAVWNVANPAAVVARHNLARATSGQTLDIAYLDRLGADAAPTVLRSLDELEPATASAVRDAVCRDHSTASPSLFATNLAVRRAAHARATCLLVAPDR